jgi:hypothetical protein
MLNLERIPDQVGYLVLNEDGAVVAVRNIQRFYQWRFLVSLGQGRNVTSGPLSREGGG